MSNISIALQYGNRLRISYAHGDLRLSENPDRWLLTTPEGSYVEVVKDDVDSLSHRHESFYDVIEIDYMRPVNASIAAQKMIDTLCGPKQTSSSGAALHKDGHVLSIHDREGLVVAETVTCYQVSNRLGTVEVRRSVVDSFTHRDDQSVKIYFKNPQACEHVFRGAQHFLCAQQSVDTWAGTKIEGLPSSAPGSDEECGECYGTGFRHGFGAPCSKGCVA